MKRLLIVCCLVLAAFALPKHYEYYGEIPQNRLDDPFEFLIAVKYSSKQLEDLDQFFHAVSNPRSPIYGEFKTQQQMAKAMRPPKDRLERVLNWIQPVADSYEITEYGAFITVRSTIRKVNDLLSIKLRKFRSLEKSPYIVIRSEETYTLPASVEDGIDILGDVCDFPPRRLNMQNLQSNFKIKAAEGNAPLPDIVQGSSNAFFPIVYPVCSNGNTTTNTTSPCAEVGNAIKSFRVQLNYIYLNLEEVYDVPISPDNVNCALVSGAARCTINTMTSTIYAFEAANVSISSVYMNGNVSLATTFPFSMTQSDWMTPDRIKSLYGIPLGKIKNNEEFHRSHYNLCTVDEGKTVVNSTKYNMAQGVVEFGNQYYRSEDFQSYCNYMGLQEPVVFDRSAQTNNASHPGVESMSDIEWIVGISPSAPNTFWWTKGGFLGWAVEANNDTFPPTSFSISYDSTDSINTDLVGKYQARIDVEFQKLGAKGVSIAVGSGDGGATNIGHGAKSCDKMHPLYPTSSPYVVSVGASMLANRVDPVCYTKVFGSFWTKCDRVGEIMVSVPYGIFWNTGGGFSDRTPRQPYQTEAVSMWQSNVPSSQLPPSSMFNISGRAYPDVSAIGHNLLVVIGGRLQPIDGTSLAGPVWAGIISLLNNARLSQNLPPLGFPNYFLYQTWENSQYRSAFTDITVGNNQCGAYEASSEYPLCCPYGFNSAPNYDPVSGLGSAYYPVLKEAALSGS